VQNLMTFGDHSQFYIYDRVGLNTEFIPHLLSTASGRPTGQRGIYGWWRTGADMFFVGTTPPVLLLQNQ
jgi:predicted phage gp36 major capsid-like protein